MDKRDSISIGAILFLALVYWYVKKGPGYFSQGDPATTIEVVEEQTKEEDVINLEIVSTNSGLSVETDSNVVWGQDGLKYYKVVAIGRNAISSGSHSIAIGRNAISSGSHSIAIGRNATSKKDTIKIGD